MILSNHITVYCSATDTTDEARAEQVEAIDTLAERLRTMPDADRIQRIRYRIDPAEMMEVAEFVTDNMPYFLTDEDYQRIDSTDRYHPNTKGWGYECEVESFVDPTDDIDVENVIGKRVLWKTE